MKCCFPFISFLEAFAKKSKISAPTLYIKGWFGFGCSPFYKLGAQIQCRLPLVPIVVVVWPPRF
ncbi:hypothetical protein SLEP1_g42032 [Rubroshorea leprosula]|uniref:Uncharacterized protein n=1 Tax=Rubroshorea leprosula TaxID=152421 RepID=A0AAV5L8H4_9ROSI|nr:hypothetical protein SLEP1_g42032 [Rubroshorea leprosula]